MDRFLSLDTAWKSRYQDESDIDDMLVPESAELFVTLLLTMTGKFYLVVHYLMIYLMLLINWSVQTMTCLIFFAI